MKKEIIDSKTVFTSQQMANYCGYSRYYIYQLVFHRKIPAHKTPSGRKLFFLKSEIDEWLLSRKLETVEEIKANMINEKYLNLKK